MRKKSAFYSEDTLVHTISSWKNFSPGNLGTRKRKKRKLMDI